MKYFATNFYFAQYLTVLTEKVLKLQIQKYATVATMKFTNVENFTKTEKISKLISNFLASLINRIFMT